MTKRPPRVILAKPGLDGHDKGVCLVAMSMRDAGFDVHYLGLRQSIDSIAAAAKERDADFIGLSVLSGTHLRVADRMLQKLREEKLRCRFFIGGVIPKADVLRLLELGVDNVFPVGTTFAAMNQWILEHCEE